MTKAYADLKCKLSHLEGSRYRVELGFRRPHDPEESRLEEGEASFDPDALRGHHAGSREQGRILTESLLAEAEAATERIKLGCDLLVGARLLDDLTQSEQDALLANALIDYVAGEPFTDRNAERAVAAARRLPAFHWTFEFPEVFARGGFSAFTGNPPFLGGTRISTEFGKPYLGSLQQAYPSFHSRADLCSIFFLRAFGLLCARGSSGLIATNTVAQGDTREAGLDVIVENGGDIYSAVTLQSWPGTAAVIVSVVCLYKGSWKGRRQLDGEVVSHISAHLDSLRVEGKPYRLQQNAERSFTGSKLDGIGFVLSIDEARDLLTKDESNADVLFPYLTGKDLNSNLDQFPSRWVIDFGERTLLEAKQYPDCLAIARERVMPQRQEHKEARTKKYWWRFQRRRPELYETIAPLSRVLVVAQTSRTLAFSFVPNGWVYSMMTIIFAFGEPWAFALLQSSLHETWARRYASTLKQDLRYTPTDIFDTFPFPDSCVQRSRLLDSTGETYHEHRRQVMLARQEGLTKTYNRFHDPEETAEDIARLRELHVEMDQAAAAAYGWEDLDLDHGFYETAQGVRFTISESARREVLTRLLELNHERYAEEVRQGLHEKKGKKGSTKKSSSRRKKADDRQMSLF